MLCTLVKELDITGSSEMSVHSYKTTMASHPSRQPKLHDQHQEPQISQCH